jgi:hypothetical protein
MFALPGTVRYVRFGPEADISVRPRDVRSGPEIRHAPR